MVSWHLDCPRSPQWVWLAYGWPSSKVVCQRCPCQSHLLVCDLVPLPAGKNVEGDNRASLALGQRPVVQQVTPCRSVQVGDLGSTVESEDA